MRQNLDSDMTEQLVDSTQSTNLEEIWRQTYDNHRNEWKKKLSAPPGLAALHTQVTESSFNGNAGIISDGSAFRNALNGTSNSEISYTPAIQQQIEATDPDCHVDIADIIQEYTLNTEQARAFRIVAEHSLLEKPEALCMYLGGPGGTGKS